MHGFDTPVEYSVRVLVVPVVQDVAQQVCLRTSWEGFEEAAPGHLSPVGDVVRAKGAGGLGRRGFEVDQVAAELRMRGKNPGEEGAATAADVDDRAEAIPVAVGDDPRNLSGRPSVTATRSAIGVARPASSTMAAIAFSTTKIDGAMLVKPNVDPKGFSWWNSRPSISEHRAG